MSYQGRMRLVSDGREPVLRAADSDSSAYADLPALIAERSLRPGGDADPADHPCRHSDASMAPAVVFVSALAFPVIAAIALISGKGLLAATAWGLGLAAPVALTLIVATLLAPRARDCGDCGGLRGHDPDDPR